MPCNEGPSTWEAARENIPDGMYKMTEFDEDNMEDGKPPAKHPTNNTTKTNTPSSKQKGTSCIQRNEAKFCEGRGSANHMSIL